MCVENFYHNKGELYTYEKYNPKVDYLVTPEISREPHPIEEQMKGKKIRVCMGNRVDNTDPNTILYTVGIANCKAIVLIYITSEGKIGCSLEHCTSNSHPKLGIPNGAFLLEKHRIDGPDTNIRDKLQEQEHLNNFAFLETHNVIGNFKIESTTWYKNFNKPSISGTVSVAIDLKNEKIIVCLDL